MAALMTFRSGNRRPAVWIDGNRRRPDFRCPNSVRPQTCIPTLNDGVRGAWRYRPCYAF